MNRVQPVTSLLSSDSCSHAHGVAMRHRASAEYTESSRVGYPYPTLEYQLVRDGLLWTLPGTIIASCWAAQLAESLSFVETDLFELTRFHLYKRWNEIHMEVESVWRSITERLQSSSRCLFTSAIFEVSTTNQSKVSNTKPYLITYRGRGWTVIIYISRRQIFHLNIFR